jgi:hypothetical protein
MSGTPAEASASDWLLTWALAQNPAVVSHYWHMADGDHETCGCPLQGEDDPR